MVWLQTVCWVKTELSRQPVALARREGDPGIHMHGQRENCRLRPLPPQLGPRAQALLQAPGTEDRLTHNPICNTPTFQQEGGDEIKKNKEEEEIPLSLSVFPITQQKMQTERDSRHELYILPRRGCIFYCIQGFLI